MAKQERFGVGVFVFIFNRDFSKILLIKRNEDKKKKYGFYWGAVGGKLEFGEFSVDSAIREAKEEIGVELKKSEVRLLEMKELPHFTDIVHGFAFYYAAILDEKTKVTINDESIGYQWFDVNKLPEDRSPHDDIPYILEVAKEKFGFRG